MSEKILAVVRTILGDDATVETTIESMPDWDSLKTLRLVMALDEEGIFVPFERIAEIRSVADIVKFSGRGTR